MIFDFESLPWYIRKQYKEEDIHTALTGRKGKISYTIFLKNGEKHKYRWSELSQEWVSIIRER